MKAKIVRISEQLNEGAVEESFINEVAANKKWQEIVPKIKECYKLFNNVKKELQSFYQEVPFDRTKELAGNRQPTIVRKIFNYTGDVTPAMLNNLIKDVEKTGIFMKDPDVRSTKERYKKEIVAYLEGIEGVSEVVTYLDRISVFVPKDALVQRGGTLPRSVKAPDYIVEAANKIKSKYGEFVDFYAGGHFSKEKDAYEFAILTDW